MALEDIPVAEPSALLLLPTPVAQVSLRVAEAACLLAPVPTSTVLVGGFSALATLAASPDAAVQLEGPDASVG